jgi:hypothetical protein
MFRALVRRATPIVLGVLVVVSLAAAAASTRRSSHEPNLAPSVSQQQEEGSGIFRIR